MLSRRHLLGAAALTGLLPLIASAQTASSSTRSSSAGTATTRRRQLVMIELQGGNDGLNNNSDLCNSGFGGNQSGSVSQALDARESCDDGGNIDGDGCSAGCAVELGFTCSAASPSVCAPVPVRTSCLAHRQAGVTVSGEQVIDPDGAGPIPSSTVFCDMVTDGGGYTFFKVLQSLQDDGAEAFCATRGMQLLIPRTQAHYQSALQVALNGGIGPSASAEYARILGVYPDFNGATCTGQPLNSITGTCPWHARDARPFFIHNSNGFGEPNGDNCTTCSMTYNYDGGGNLVNFNDGGHTSASAFICDVGDKF